MYKQILKELGLNSLILYVYGVISALVSSMIFFILIGVGLSGSEMNEILFWSFFWIPVVLMGGGLVYLCWYLVKKSDLKIVIGSLVIASLFVAISYPVISIIALAMVWIFPMLFGF